MANFGLHTQNGVYNAPDDRFGLGAFAQRDASGKVIPGVVQSPSTDALVSAASTPNLTVTVRPFVAITTDSGIGAYVGGIDTVTVVPALAPELANNRYDILAWRHLEGITTNSNGETTLGAVTLAGQSTPTVKQIQSGEVYWIKGTPSSSSSPAVPGVPAGSVPLARVYVAGGTTAISQANIVDIHRDVTPVGGVVSQPSATIGASTDLPAGVLVRYPDGILESNGSTFQQVAGVPREVKGTVGSQVAISGSGSSPSATVVTFSLSANVGVRVEARCGVLAASGQPDAFGRGVVQYSVNGGAWADCSDYVAGEQGTTQTAPATLVMSGYIDPAGSARTIALRVMCTAGSAGGRFLDFHVYATPVKRVTSL